MVAIKEESWLKPSIKYAIKPWNCLNSIKEVILKFFLSTFQVCRCEILPSAMSVRGYNGYQHSKNAGLRNEKINTSADLSLLND